MGFDAYFSRLSCMVGYRFAGSADQQVAGGRADAAQAASAGLASGPARYIRPLIRAHTQMKAIGPSTCSERRPGSLAGFSSEK